MGNTLYMSGKELQGYLVSDDLVLGGYDGMYEHNEVLEWRDQEQEWVKVGCMKMTRSFHSMTTITLPENYCEQLVCTQSFMRVKFLICLPIRHLVIEGLFVFQNW